MYCVDAVVRFVSVALVRRPTLLKCRGMEVEVYLFDVNIVG